MTDRNGYAPSIIQTDTASCYLCGRRDRKLDPHGDGKEGKDGKD